jgi:hypothetical protein
MRFRCTSTTRRFAASSRKMKIAIAWAIGLAGCSETDVTTVDCNDVAQLVAGSTSIDIAAMADVVTLSQGDLVDGFTLDAGVFSGTRLQIDYSYMITCVDAGGTTLATCGGTTDTADVSYTWAGSIALPTIGATITREGNWTIRGLQSTTAQLVGNATFVDDATIAGSSYHFDSTATYAAIAIDVASQAATGGTITLDVDATRQESSGAVSFTVPATVVIGSGSARINVDNAFDYTTDFATGSATSAGSP